MPFRRRVPTGTDVRDGEAIKMRKLSFAGLVLLPPAGAFAQANKVNVCHATGKGGFQLIRVASSALRTHLQHGDKLPGETVLQGTP